jgi:DNA-binding transcriptional ArsR family regulator
MYLMTVRQGVFKALSDPTRRQILELLAQRDLTAGEIADRFPIAFASVSRHLGILRDAGLVATEREGQFIRYRLNTTVHQELVRYLMRVFGGGSAHA